MTYQRVIHRNNLYEGDYNSPRTPDKFVTANRIEEENIGTQRDIYLNLARTYMEEWAREKNSKLMLLGDLRRFENDSVDENATCKYIASKTGIDAEIVAAVLKEFMAW